jgi:tRNA(fMet)-specific endonuclease VapC
MGNAKTIIDTDILIDLLRNKKQAVAFIARLEKKESLLSTTVINEFELYYGAHKSSNSKRSLQATKKLINRLIVLPLTPRSARKAGHTYAKLETEGQSIGLRDTLIGAIALTNGFRVATHNTQHFKKIRDLQIISTQEDKISSGSKQIKAEI